MEEIIDFVKRLINKDVAYEVEGDVYFKPRAFDEYGKLSDQSIDELRSGARIKIGENKEDPLDFALWKKAKQGEVAWDSRSEEHTSELQSRGHLVCRLLLEKKKE